MQDIFVGAGKIFLSLEELKRYFKIWTNMLIEEPPSYPPGLVRGVREGCRISFGGSWKDVFIFGRAKNIQGDFFNWPPPLKITSSKTN